MHTISKPKYVLFMIVIGVGIAILNIVIRQVLDALSISLPAGLVGGGTTGAGFVLAIVLVNRSIQREGCQWLLKRQ